MGTLQVAENIRNGADVVFVAVGEHNGANRCAVLLQIGDVWNDDVDAEKFDFGKHQAGVDDQDVVAIAQHHHVHSEFAETA